MFDMAAKSYGMSRYYYVYVLSSETRELYVGITNNLDRRLAEHRASYNPHSYSSRHATNRLVYFEVTSDPGSGNPSRKATQASEPPTETSSD